jgi:hypothetical protein
MELLILVELLLLCTFLVFLYFNFGSQLSLISTTDTKTQVSEKRMLRKEERRIMKER